MKKRYFFFSIFLFLHPLNAMQHAVDIREQFSDNPAKAADWVSYCQAREIADTTIELLKIFQKENNKIKFCDLRKSKPNVALRQDGLKIVSMGDVPYAIYCKWGKWQFLDQLRCPRGQRDMISAAIAVCFVMQQVKKNKKKIKSDQDENHNAIIFPQKIDKQQLVAQWDEFTDHYKRLQKTIRQAKQNQQLKARL